MITASVLADREWGYAAILITSIGKRKRMLADVVIQDDDAPGVCAADLAEEFIQFMEDASNGYDVDTWDWRAWDHRLCYEEFLRRRPFLEAA